MNDSSILIIDDSREWCDITNEILTLAGHTTYIATNGMEGLKYAREYKPNLILCDVTMPKLDGYGVLRALETIPEMNNVPFIFMTFNADKIDFRNGMDSGADDYLIKPFDASTLLKAISARLKKHVLRKKILENNSNKQNEFINPDKIYNDILRNNKTTRKIRKKDMLFMEGDSANFLYFIISGKIKIFKSSEVGKEYITNVYKEGDFIGYSSLLEDVNYRESAMAIEDSEVVIINKQNFFQLLNSNTEAAIKFMKLILKDYSELQGRLIKLAYDSARKRVADALIFISNKYMTDGSKELSFTIQRENISALCGVSPESVSRTLTEFKEEGLIETCNGNIKIINLEKMKLLKN